MTNEMVRFTLRLPSNIKNQLEAQSKEMCVSLNSLVIQILRDWEKRNLAEKTTLKSG